MTCPTTFPPVGIGAVMRAFGVGEVVASRHPGYAEDDIVTGLLGWQRYALCDGAEAARGAIGMLYRGENTGKLLVRPD